MIIVEGPDAAGKSTLCKKLVESLAGRGYVYSHLTRLPAGFDRYWGYAERASRRVVQDRFHLSEIVYAAARGDVSPLTPEIYRLVDARLRNLGAFTVLVASDLRLISSRWDETQMYDRAITGRAAELFRAVGHGPFLGYQADVDLKIECGYDHPYPDEDDVKRIVIAYLARQDALEGVAWRKRPTLDGASL